LPRWIADDDEHASEPGAAPDRSDK
jgi:hypothetical protein